MALIYSTNSHSSECTGKEFNENRVRAEDVNKSSKEVLNVLSEVCNWKMAEITRLKVCDVFDNKLEMYKIIFKERLVELKIDSEASYKSWLSFSNSCNSNENIEMGRKQYDKGFKVYMALSKLLNNKELKSCGKAIDEVRRLNSCD